MRLPGQQGGRPAPLLLHEGRRRPPHQLRPLIVLRVVRGEGAAEATVERQQRLVLEGGGVQVEEALAGAVVVTGLGQAPGLFVAGAEAALRPGQRVPGRRQRLPAGGAVVAVVLHGQQQGPGRRRARVGLHEGQRPLGVAGPHQRADAHPRLTPPAQRQVVEGGQPPQERVRRRDLRLGVERQPLLRPAVGVAVLVGEVAGQRPRLAGQVVLEGRLLRRVEAAGRQQHVQADALVAAVGEAVAEDGAGLVGVPARPGRGQQPQGRLLVEVLVRDVDRGVQVGARFEAGGPHGVVARPQRQRQHHQARRLRRQVRRVRRLDLAADLGLLLVLGVQQADLALAVVDGAQPHLVVGHLDQPPFGQAAVLGEDEMDLVRLLRLVLGPAQLVRHDGHGALADDDEVGAAGQVLGGRHEAGDQAGQAGAVEAAHGAAGAEADLRVQVQQRRAVADDDLAQAEGQSPLVGVAARAVEADDEGRAVAVLERQRPPLRLAGAVDQLAGLGLNAARGGPQFGGGLLLQHGLHVGPGRVQPGGVGRQVGEQALVVGVGQALVEEAIGRTPTAQA